MLRRYICPGDRMVMAALPPAPPEKIPSSTTKADVPVATITGTVFTLVRSRIEAMFCINWNPALLWFNSVICSIVTDENAWSIPMPYWKPWIITYLASAGPKYWVRMSRPMKPCPSSDLMVTFRMAEVL